MLALMKTTLDLERVGEEVPPHIVWGKRAPGEENQLAPFLRWVAWVSNMTLGEVAESLEYHPNAYHVNTRSSGASSLFVQRVFLFLQETFAGCPIDLRQVILLTEIDGEDSCRWRSLQRQIAAHYREDS